MTAKTSASSGHRTTTLTDHPMPGDSPEVLALKVKIRAVWDKGVAARAAALEATKEGARLRRELAVLVKGLKLGDIYTYQDEHGVRPGVLQPHDDMHLFRVMLLNLKTGALSKKFVVVRYIDSLTYVGPDSPASGES